MKRILLALAGISVLLGTGVLFLRLNPGSGPAEAAPRGLPADVRPEWTAAVEFRGEEVFQRAFWRRPGPDDRILQAERTQWSDTADGVRKWQWFLALHPGPALTAWLKETNPFSLRRFESWSASEDSPLTRRPEWFPGASAAGWEVYRSGSMTLLFDPGKGMLFAMDTGGGFQQPVERRAGGGR